MRIDILSCVPKLMESFFQHSILQRAQNKGLVEIHLHDFREFSNNKQKQVDDYPYGGEAGMVLTCQPIVDCIKFLQSQRGYDEVIFLTPDGNTLNQKMVNSMSMYKNLILLAGHYKGIDQRIRDKYITKEISIGDYVLSGGEIAAVALADAIIRVIPGVIGDEMSALTDSFQDDLLSPPVYTRPRVFEEMEVPKVLLNGDHAKIQEWQLQMALEKTKKLRPDLLKNDE